MRGLRPFRGQFPGDRRDADAPGAIPRGSAGAGTVEGAARRGGRYREFLYSPVPRLPCYSIASGRGSRAARCLAALHHAREDLVYPVEGVGRKLGPRGRHVVLDLLGPRRPDDGAADVRLAQHPREGELGHGEARVRRHVPQPLYRREDVLVHELAHKAAGLWVGGAGSPLRRLAGVVLAREDALGERGEDNLPHALALREGDDLGLYPALDHVVPWLVGDDPVEVHLLREAQRVGYLVRRPLRDADVEHLALPHEVVERPQRILERGSLVVAVALVEVHVVHPESPQRGVALLGYVLAREAPVVRPVAHGEVDLGGEKKGV